MSARARPRGTAPGVGRRAAARLAVRLAVSLAAATLVACANPGIPPGGPPDSAAPAIVRVTPDSGAVNVRASSVVIRLDEVVAERPGGRSPIGSAEEGLRAIVLLSPGDGRERVHWRRDAIEIEPRGGFRRNTAYRVTLLPGLADLRGNAVTERFELVFSTGPAIPAGSISGVVFDWVEGRAAARASVEAFQPGDSTFRWVTRTDSTGRFILRDLAPGPYRLRGWLDANNDRRIGEREAFDSVTVTLADTLTQEFYAFAHDTIGPRLEAVETADSTALRVRFDRPAAPSWIPVAASFRLLRADSSEVPLGDALPSARWDSLAAAARARADSIAADSAARADTAGTRPDAPARAGARADTATRTGAAVRPIRILDQDSLAADSLAARLPRLARPVPIRAWVIALPAPLAPGTYRLHASAIEGLAGTRRDSEREFRIAAPPPPRDTTTTPPDGPPTPPARDGATPRGSAPARP